MSEQEEEQAQHAPNGDAHEQRDAETPLQLLKRILPIFDGQMDELHKRLDDSLIETLRVFTGPMSSGKSDHLITSCTELELQHVPCVIVRSSTDTRSAPGKVQSQTGKMKQCIVLRNLDGHGAEFDEYLLRNAQVIFIDEAQFFGEDLISFCTRMTHRHKKSVWVYGLNGDSNRSKFGYIADLMPLWTEHKTLTGYCGTCKKGKRACYTRALVKKQQQVLPGSQGQHYVTECAQCYNKHSNTDDQ